MIRPVVSVVIPVYNEEKILESSIGRLVAFLEARLHYPYEIVVADNASTDGTFAIADDLSRRHLSVRSVRLERKGRGGALKTVWSQSSADVLTYMDVDLATDLEAFPPLVACLLSDSCDLASASRLIEPHRTQRRMHREVLSRGYNLLVRGMFNAQFSDAQCGFKGITHQAAAALLPLIEHDGWFMDTELLVLAEKLGYRIREFPANWIEGSDSRVKIISTVLENLSGLVRLRLRLLTGNYDQSQRKKRSI